MSLVSVLDSGQCSVHNGAKVTGHSMFNMLPVASSDFCAICIFNETESERKGDCI